MRLTLAQIENPRPGKLARTLVLDGSLAPIDTLSFGIEQRVEMEMIPGSRVPALQFSGAEYDPTEIRFSWKGRRFSEGEATLDDRPILTIDELVDTVVSMVDDTALVEVTWRGRSRKAVLQAFKPKEGRIAEFDAVLTVMWAEGPPETLWVPTERVARNPRGIIAQIEAFIEGVDQNYNTGLDGVQGAVTWAKAALDDVAAVVARVRENVYRLRVAVDSARNLGQSVQGTWNATGAALTEMWKTTEAAWDALAMGASQLAQSDEASQQIEARLWRSEKLRAARKLRHAAALEARNYRPESDVLAIYEAVEGDTIWSVARRYYGDPQRGPEIARRNNLISAHLRPGQRIVIPAPEAA